MKKMLKRIAAASAAVLVMTTSIIGVEAASKNNTGNSHYYNSNFRHDLSRWGDEGCYSAGYLLYDAVSSKKASIVTYCSNTAGSTVYSFDYKEKGKMVYKSDKVLNGKSYEIVQNVKNVTYFRFDYTPKVGSKKLNSYTRRISTDLKH